MSAGTGICTVMRLTCSGSMTTSCAAKPKPCVCPCAAAAEQHKFFHKKLYLPPGVLVSAFVSQPGQRALIIDELVPAAMASSVCRKLSRSGSMAAAAATGEAAALHMVSSMVLQMLQVHHRCRTTEQGV